LQVQEKWQVTETDVRDLCKQWEIAFPILKAAHRNLARGVKDITLYDVLYVMGQAKMMGLPPVGPWFVLIPASDWQKKKGITGPSVCFRMDAALYLMDHHPRVEPSSEEHFWTGAPYRQADGVMVGTRYEADNPPFFVKSRETDTLPKIDFELTCTVSVQLLPQRPATGGKRISRTLRYRDWCRNMESPESLWVKMPSHMLWKQTCKELVRMHFGGGIWEDEAQTIDVTPAPAEPTKLDPGYQAIPAIPVRTVDAPVSPNQTIIGEAETQRLRKCCQSLGIPLETMIAGLREFTGRGGTVEQFLTETEKSCASPAQPEPKGVQVITCGQDYMKPEDARPDQEPPGIIHTEEDEPQEGPEPPIEDMQQAQDEAPEPDRDAYADL
jgi:hypothetical protein